MSYIALRTFVLPEALAPNIPATGRTSTGVPPSRQETERRTSFSESVVASIESSNLSRNDLTF